MQKCKVIAFRIILEAAYSLRDRAFAENLGTIMLYAVVVGRFLGPSEPCAECTMLS